MWEGAAGLVSDTALAPAAAPLADPPPLVGAAGLEAGLANLMLPKEAAMLALTLMSDSFLGALFSGRAAGLGRGWGGLAGMESLLGESGAGVSFFKASMRALVACTASSAADTAHDNANAESMPFAYIKAQRM